MSQEKQTTVEKLFEQIKRKLETAGVEELAEFAHSCAVMGLENKHFRVLFKRIVETLYLRTQDPNWL